MKIKSVIYSVVVFFHMLATASAAQHTITNGGDGSSSNGVTDHAGNLISGPQGSAAFGYFDSDLAVTESTSAADLLDADWHIAGGVGGDSETSFNSNTPLNGTFTTDYNLTDSNFEGKSIYLVLGNGSSLDVSTNLFVYKFNETFDTTSIDPITLDLDADELVEANILIGSVGASQAIVAGGTPSQETLKMSVLDAVVIVPVLNSLNINNDSADTESQTVTLNHIKSGAAPTEYKASENADFSGAVWQAYDGSSSFELSPGSAVKTVYLKLKNAEGESATRIDTINYSDESSAQIPVLVSVSINDGAEDTESRIVTLNHIKSGAAPTEYKASENDDFSGAEWQNYTDNPSFQLSAGSAVKTVYLKLRSADGESSANSDTINYEKVDSGDLLEHPDEPASSPPSTDSELITAGKGKFSGFLRSADDGLVGYFKSFKVSSSGKLSAKLSFDGASYSLKGNFDEFGVFSKEITPKSGAAATVKLQLVQTAGGAYKVEGTVELADTLEEEGQTASVVLVKSGNTFLYKGRYTLLIPGEDDGSSDPQGHGYGVMSVSSKGSAKIKGRLGDGSKWTAGCKVTVDGEMPLYRGLYKKKKGWIGGLISFREVEGVSDCDGELHWRKPGEDDLGGFDFEPNLIGSIYDFKTVIAGGAVTPSDVVADVGAEFVLGVESDFGAISHDLGRTKYKKKKAYYTGLGKVKLTLAAKTGLISGSIPDNGVKFKVAGVVFQKQDLAAGMVTAKRVKPRSLVITPIE